jgi:hypothetical protein
MTNNNEMLHASLQDALSGWPEAVETEELDCDDSLLR